MVPPFPLENEKKIRASVQSTMSRERLTKEVVRNFAQRARGYTCAYYAIGHRQENGKLQGEEISPQLIKWMVNQFKMHRCAINFEGNYIVKMEKTDENNSKIGSNNENNLPNHV